MQPEARACTAPPAPSRRNGTLVMTIHFSHAMVSGDSDIERIPL
jgi:hypothetical protein